MIGAVPTCRRRASASSFIECTVIELICLQRDRMSLKCLFSAASNGRFVHKAAIVLYPVQENFTMQEISENWDDREAPFHIAQDQSPAR